MDEQEIPNALNILAATRPIFHSEADLQFSLAWQLQRQMPQASLRLEAPLAGLPGRAALDILVRGPEGVTAIEVKYYKSQLSHEVEDEKYALLTTGAYLESRHDACKDICRLEHAISSGQADNGVFVLLSNDPAFWREPLNPGTFDAAFRIHHGQVLTGRLDWHERTGGTKRKRESTLDLGGSYTLRWLDYSDLGVRNGKFRSMVLSVPLTET